MRKGVEEYRGVWIYRSRAAAPRAPEPSDDWWEAYLDGWRIVGPLARVRDQIARLLDADAAPPKHKSLPMI